MYNIEGLPRAVVEAAFKKKNDENSKLRSINVPGREARAAAFFDIWRQQHSHHCLLAACNSAVLASSMTQQPMAAHLPLRSCSGHQRAVHQQTTDGRWAGGLAGRDAE